MASSFASLERIVTINVTYRTHGMVAMNTGRGDGLQDNTVSRASGAESPPILLGSGLKGVSRSLIEAILAQAAPDQVCAPKVCCQQPRGPERPPPGRKAFCEDEAQGGPCPACQMFGNTRMRGRVTFHDAHPDSEVHTTARTHVGIARATGTAAHQALMTMEAVPGMGMPFTGKVTLVNPDPWMVGAIWETLPLLASVGIGAKKTSGYGDVVVQERPILTFTLRPAGEQVSDADYLQSCREAWRQLAKIAPPPLPWESK